MRTKRRFSRSHTSILTGTSGMYLLPCSMAFIVASATAVLSRSRVLSGNPSPLTVLATSCVACRSLPGSLGKLSSASVCRVLLLGAVKVPDLSQGHQGYVILLVPALPCEGVELV